MPTFNLRMIVNFKIKMFLCKTSSFPQRSEKLRGGSKQIPPDVAPGKSLLKQTFRKSGSTFFEMAILTEKSVSSHNS